MKPIISPWSIYFASRADSLKIIAGCILMFATIAIFIAFMVGVEDGDIFTYKSFMKKMRNYFDYKYNSFSNCSKHENYLYNGNRK